MARYTKDDALPRLNKALIGSLAPAFITRPYLEALRRDVAAWLERIDETLATCPEPCESCGDYGDLEEVYISKYVGGGVYTKVCANCADEIECEQAADEDFQRRAYGGTVPELSREMR